MNGRKLKHRLLVLLICFVSALPKVGLATRMVEELQSYSFSYQLRELIAGNWGNEGASPSFCAADVIGCAMQGFARAHWQLLQTNPRSNASTEEYFVTVSSDGNFALGCQKFFVAGWNQCGPGSSRTHQSRTPAQLRIHMHNAHSCMPEHMCTGRGACEVPIGTYPVYVLAKHWRKLALWPCTGGRWWRQERVRRCFMALPCPRARLGRRYQCSAALMLCASSCVPTACDCPAPCACSVRLSALKTEASGHRVQWQACIRFTDACHACLLLVSGAACKAGMACSTLAFAAHLQHDARSGPEQPEHEAHCVCSCNHFQYFAADTHLGSRAHS